MQQVWFSYCSQSHPINFGQIFHPFFQWSITVHDAHVNGKYPRHLLTDQDATVTLPSDHRDLQYPSLYVKQSDEWLQYAVQNNIDHPNNVPKPPLLA